METQRVYNNCFIHAISEIECSGNSTSFPGSSLLLRSLGTRLVETGLMSFSYPEPFLRAVNGARQGALAKSISNWHLIGYNEGYCSNNVYILLPCFYGIRFWIWPEPLVAPRVRRALGTRMGLCKQVYVVQDLSENHFVSLCKLCKLKSC